MARRWHRGGACAAYAALMLYASTVIGPGGTNFVYKDPVATFRIFLATPYVLNGSDQRADWMGNLLMLVPFGFLTARLLWPTRLVLKAPAACLALLIAFTTIVTIKYLQLFFPPRTVTLNYIAAQTLGAAVGCMCFALWHERISGLVSGRDPVAGFFVALWLYFFCLVVFLLMPLDFALDSADLRGQFGRLPEAMLRLPGSNRHAELQAILIVAAGAAFIPVGVLLAFPAAAAAGELRSLLAVTGWGLLVTTLIFALSTLVIGAYPVAASILYRTCGILAGASAITWLARQDVAALRRQFRWWAPWIAVVYALALLQANRLLSVHWLSPGQAIAQAYPLGLLPLFDYYIVSKAEAAKNIVGHALMYAPVGILLWMHDGGKSGGRAFAVAATVGFLVELARYFRPGLEGDINAVAVAGLSAMFSARLMPAVWAMLEALVEQSAVVPGRRLGAAGPRDGHRTPGGRLSRTEPP